MNDFTNEELTETLFVLSSTLTKCEKAQLKFRIGTSQHTLLKNRIRALSISKELVHAQLMRSGGMENNFKLEEIYTMEELKQAVPPITSIISKCEKAQAKYEKKTAWFNRYEKIIRAMKVSKAFIEDKLDKVSMQE